MLFWAKVFRFFACAFLRNVVLFLSGLNGATWSLGGWVNGSAAAGSRRQENLDMRYEPRGRGKIRAQRNLHCRRHESILPSVWRHMSYPT